MYIDTPQVLNDLKGSKPIKKNESANSMILEKVEKILRISNQGKKIIIEILYDDKFIPAIIQEYTQETLEVLSLSDGPLSLAVQKIIDINILKIEKE
ncbi:MAG: hypothetical protein FWE36_06525 [Erysipelotrichales bacterium]|nr:hypothetical protein [Erysipelotrichales bacterium]